MPWKNVPLVTPYILLREICYIAAIYEFEVREVHVPGVSNKLADVLSRWDSCSFSAKEQFLQRAQRDHCHEVPVPDALFRLYGTFYLVNTHA